MYEIAKGPLFIVCFLFFIGGIIYRVFQLYTMTKKKQKEVCPVAAIRKSSDEEKKFQGLIAFKNSVLGKHPVMMIVSTLFHLLLLVTILFAMGHNVLIEEAIGISFFSLPDAATHTLTYVAVAGILFFMVRRLVIPQVFALSGFHDYFLLLLTAVPVISALIAYEQWLPYKTMITIHVLSADLLMVMLPFSKLGHMIFYVFSRLNFSNELQHGKGNRVWSV